MKYFIRSVKYFFYFIFIMAIILAALIFIGVAEANIGTMFRDGYNSLWQIALLFAVISGVYPMFGFVKRDASFAGNWDEVKGDIRKYMEDHNYCIEKDYDDTMTFRRKGALSRFSRMYEDRVTITSKFAGAALEGLRKDVLRLSAGIEYTLESKNSSEA